MIRVKTHAQMHVIAFDFSVKFALMSMHAIAASHSLESSNQKRICSELPPYLLRKGITCTCNERNMNERRKMSAASSNPFSPVMWYVRERTSPRGVVGLRSLKASSLL